MYSTKDFSSLVGEIYDCVAEPSLWTGVLEQLTRKHDGLLTTLSVLDTVNQTARFAATFGDDAIVRPLVTTYAQDMPFYHVIPRMEIDVPVTLDTIYEFAGPGAELRMHSSRLGREWFTPHNINNCICMALLKQSRSVGTIVITTTRDRPPIQQPELDAFGMIAPHIRRAVTIGDLFETRKSETDIYRDILNQLATPLLIVGADMRIFFANIAAEDLLRASDKLISAAGKLVFVHEPAQGSIKRAVAGSERNEFALGGLGIGVPTQGKGETTVAHVLPLARRSAAGRLDERAAAAIFLNTPGGDPLPAIEAMAGLFGLTPQERRVAMLVAGGKTRAQIAAMQDVSDSTVKSQLDSIFSKTATNSQRSLQNLIRDLALPVRKS